MVNSSKVQTKEKPNSKKKRPKTKMNALYWLSETQFHGANRLADKSIRWFWIPSMLLLFIVAVTNVILNIHRYQQSPTYMVQQDTYHQVMTFPSVLVCPEINFRTYKKNAFLESMKYPKDLNETYVRRVLPQLAAFFSPDVMFNMNDLKNLEKLLDYNGLDVETAGRILTVTCEEVLIRCRWNQQNVNCSLLFQMELTGDGFCCVFNGRSLRRELKERGLKHIQKYTKAWRTSSFGMNSGLMLAINQTQRPLNIDLAYKWIAMQAGQRFVDTTNNGTAMNPGSEQWITYYARSFVINEGARALSATLRRCKMAAEPLKYFPSYRKRYCVVECEMENTIRLCHCVRLVHPRPYGVPYCNAKQLRCALHAMVAMTSADACNCPATCDVNTNLFRSWSYGLDATVKSIDPFYEGLNFSKVTVVRAFIQKREKRTKERWTYYSYLDLFAQLGGLFNMFFGCSILTILGLMHLAFRIIWTLCLSLQEKLGRRNKINFSETD